MAFLNCDYQKHPKGRYTIYFLALITFFIGLLCLIGWATRNVYLVMVYPGFHPMSVKTACMLILASGMLISFINGFVKTAFVCNIFLFFFILLFFYEGYTHHILLTNQWLREGGQWLRETNSVLREEVAQTPSWRTLTCLLCISISFFFLFTLRGKRIFHVWIAAFFSALAFNIALISAYNYLGGYGFAQDLSQMGIAPHAVLGILCLSTSELILFFCILAKKKEQLLYFNVFLTFMVMIGTSFALFSNWQKQMQLNIGNLLDTEANQVEQMLRDRLWTNTISNLRFASLIDFIQKDPKLAEPLQVYVGNIMKNFLFYVPGLEVIQVLDEEQKELQITIDEGLPAEWKVAFEEYLQTAQNKDLFFSLDHLSTGAPILLFQTHLPEGKIRWIRFIYSPSAFFATRAGNEENDLSEHLVIEVNGELIYQNHPETGTNVASTTKTFHFHELDLALTVSATQPFVAQFLGPIPYFHFILGFLFALILAFFVYLLFWFKNLSEDLRISNNAKTIFLQNVSHEIRTPLHGVIGSASLLEVSSLDAQQSRHLSRLLYSARYLLDLVNNLLDITKCEAGALELQNRRCNIKNLIQNQIDMVTHQIHNRPVTFHLHYISEGGDSILISETAMKQILTNLLGNALKFTEKGTIMIAVHLLKKEGDTGLLEMTIEDTGIGIPEEKKKFLFQKFSRLHEELHPHLRGTGLGLYLTKLLIEKMKGEVTCASSLGQGTTFRVVIPIQFTIEETDYVSRPH